MFREMRRNKQILPKEEVVEILEKSSSGVLAVLGDNDYPYTVPMNYVYADGKIYFHVAATGHKIDAIKKHDKASFCIIDNDEVVPEKFTTAYRSVVAFGRVRLVEDIEEMRRLITILTMKYSADYKERIPNAIDSSINDMALIEMTIDHVTGKEGIELVKMRDQ